MADPVMKFGVMIIVGMLLGTLFFGGLWLTIQRMQHSRHPGLLFISSVVVRTVIVLAGIWYGSGGDALSMSVCLLGFIGVRMLASHSAAVYSAVDGRKEAP